MDTKITTFIFDCFGVVCSPVLNGWYKENRLKHGLVDENILNVFQKFDLGQFSEDDIINYFLSYEGVNSTKEKIREDVDSYLHIDNQLVDTIKNLKNKGYKIALLSNGNSSFFERKLYIMFPEFKSLFDEIIISSNIGMVKPNDDIYFYALDKINSKPEESVFIDDNKMNIDAAENLGIKSFLYTDANSFNNYLENLDII